MQWRHCSHLRDDNSNAVSPDGMTVNQAVHSVEQVPLSADLPPKADPGSPWAKVISLLSQTSEKVAALAAGGALDGVAGLSTPPVRVDSDGRIEVDVWLDDVSPETLASVEANGLKIERSNLSANVVERWLGYDQFLGLAELSAVRLVSPPVIPRRGYRLGQQPG